ncbi:MAG: serine hydrolase domain-containing protein [Pseudomonadota bacterium]
MAQLEGSVAAGYESVRELLAADLDRLAEREVQLCVYVGEERVVDLWGSTLETPQAPDALANIFSSSKSLVAILLADQVAQGRIDYSADIRDYWPEFTGGGKERLKVADLMRHEAGLAAFDVSLDPQHLLAEQIKENRIGQIIEAQETRFRPEGSPREYHAVTRGWIVNELYRRVDPDGRTLGEAFADDWAAPLDLDVLIGVPAARHAEIRDVVPLSPGFYLKQGFRRQPNRAVHDSIGQFLGKMARLAPKFRSSPRRGSPPPFKGTASLDVFNDAVVRCGETPSANAHASARGLAKLAAVMAGEGRFAGGQYLPQGAWQALHDAPVSHEMGMPTTFTQGGVALFGGNAAGGVLDRAINQGREGFYGWMGLGGSIFQWHPQKRIGFAYVPTSLHVMDFLNERGKRYQAEILRIVS